MIRRIGRKAFFAARYPRRTFEQLLVLRDYLAFRARYAGLLAGARPFGNAGRTVLIVSLTEFVYGLKLEGVIAKALQLAGCRVVVLTEPWQRWAERYLGVYGVDELVVLDDYAGDPEDEIESVVATALSGDVTVQSLRRVEFHGAHVGEQALSTVSRHLERGRLSISSPEVRTRLARILRESMRSVLAAERLLGEVAPDVVLFNEKNYAGQGSVYDLALARGSSVVQWVAAGIHSRDALVFKRFNDETRRVHPTSLSAESWRRAQAMDWTPTRERALQEEFAVRYGGGELHPDAGLQAGKRIKDAVEVREQLGLAPGRRTAVIFSHVLWDANMFFGEDLFDDQETWLVETVRAACANDALDWIVKLHPANMYKSRAREFNDEIAIREALGTLPPHVRILRPETDINTYSLFSVADVGVTIRGTIGMELPVFGIPVLTAGTGRYSGLGFTIDSSSVEEYMDRLAHAHEIEPLGEREVLLAKRHAYALFRLRPFRFTTFRSRFLPPDRPRHPLRHNLELTARTSEELERAADLRALAEWLLGDELDYLEPVA